MVRTFRKAKAERTGQTILKSAENPNLGARYRISIGAGVGTGGIFTGAGTPEGVVTAPVGSIYNQIVGGVLAAQFVKVTGSGNTGWQ